MESVTGKISLKQIIKDNATSGLFKREIEYITIKKVLACKESLGYAVYQCPCCLEYKKINLTCKSRFCTSCAKKRTEQRLQKLFSRRPQQLHYFHLIFTIPEEFRHFFRKESQ